MFAKVFVPFFFTLRWFFWSDVSAVLISTNSIRFLVVVKINFFTPKNDKHLISPSNITPESNIKVMRI